MIIEDKNFLNNDQKEHLKNNVLGDNFPWYWNDHAVNVEDETGYFFHQVLLRPNDRPYENHINSNYYDFFEDVFKSFCKNNNLEYKEILRICLNASVSSNQKESFIHRDHNFPCKHMLIYLSDIKDDIGYTYIYEDDKKTLIKKIKPEMYKGVCWDWKYHSAEPPSNGRRVVIVYTFI
jgi:hypothetical protein